MKIDTLVEGYVNEHKMVAGDWEKKENTTAFKEPFYWSRPLSCAAKDCHWMTFDTTFVDPTSQPGSDHGNASVYAFRQHRNQYEPGKAPDIEVDWTPNGSCPTCDDWVEFEVQDSETLVCPQCHTIWDMHGHGGERPEAD